MFSKVYKFAAVHITIVSMSYIKQNVLFFSFSRLTAIRLFPDIYPIYFMDLVVDKKHVGSFYLCLSKSQDGVERVLKNGNDVFSICIMQRTIPQADKVFT